MGTVNMETTKVGRPHTVGTVLARVMKQRGIKKNTIAATLRVSDPTVYNYLKRRYRVPPMQLGPLCDLLDMDPEELVDSRGFLLEDQG